MYAPWPQELIAKNNYYSVYPKLIRLCLCTYLVASQLVYSATQLVVTTENHSHSIYCSRVSSLPKGGFHGNYGNLSGSTSE